MEDETHVRRDIRGKREIHLDAVAAELAARQHGVVARRQLRELGLSDDAITRRLAAGRLHQRHRGVFAVGHRRLTQRGIWAAGVLALGDGAALSHRAGGALHGVHRFEGCEVTVPRNRRPRDGIVVHCAKLPDDEVTVVDGIRVTTIERTLFDLSSLLSFTRLERCFAQAENLRLAGSLSVLDLRPGIPVRAERPRCAASSPANDSARE